MTGGWTRSYFIHLYMSLSSFIRVCVCQCESSVIVIVIVSNKYKSQIAQTYLVTKTDSDSEMHLVALMSSYTLHRSWSLLGFFHPDSHA